MRTDSCVVLLPRDAVEDEHCTLVYTGETATAVPLPFLQTLAKSTARWWPRVIANVVEHDVFGPVDDRVNVARLSPTVLSSLQPVWQPFSQSQFGFKPHITQVPGHPLRAVGSWVTFDRLAVWYGDVRLAWRLGTGEPCHTP